MACGYTRIDGKLSGQNGAAADLRSHAVVKYYFKIRPGNLCAWAQLVTCVTEQKEKRMTRFTLIGAAAVVATVLAGPAMARHVVHPIHQAESSYCATIEPGNPYSQANDYAAWSAWRMRGGWDSRGDDACARNPMFSGNF